MLDITALNPQITMAVDQSGGRDKTAICFMRGDMVLGGVTGKTADIINEFMMEQIALYNAKLEEAQTDTWNAQQAIVAALEAHQRCDGVHYAATLTVTDPLLAYIASLNLPTDPEEPANDTAH